VETEADQWAGGFGCRGGANRAWEFGCCWCTALWSAAGALLATAGMMLGEGVRGYVFVDAGLPVPGRAWMEAAPPDLAARLRGMAGPRGWLPPWSRWWGDEELAALLPDPAVRRRFAAGCPRLPLAMLGEIHPPAPGWPNASGGYLQLGEAYEGGAAGARGLGWPVRRQLSHHLALLAEPGRVARGVSERPAGRGWRRLPCPLVLARLPAPARRGPRSAAGVPGVGDTPCAPGR
jgi:hypothetical protein